MPRSAGTTSCTREFGEAAFNHVKAANSRRFRAASQRTTSTARMMNTGLLRALNRNVQREFDTSPKDTHWGRRKLKRDGVLSAAQLLSGDSSRLKLEVGKFLNTVRGRLTSKARLPI
jgi:hypothetical protein